MELCESQWNILWISNPCRFHVLQEIDGAQCMVPIFYLLAFLRKFDIEDLEVPGSGVPAHRSLSAGWRALQTSTRGWFSFFRERQLSINLLQITSLLFGKGRFLARMQEEVTTLSQLYGDFRVSARFNLCTGKSYNPGTYERGSIQRPCKAGRGYAFYFILDVASYEKRWPPPRAGWTIHGVSKIFIVKFG